MGYPNDQAQAAGAIPVWVVEGSGGTPAANFAGQVVIAVTGTAVQLPSHAVKNGFIVKSFSGNSALRQTTAEAAGLTNTVDGTGNGYILDPGEACPYVASNTNKIYVNGQAGDIFSFVGS